MFEGENTFRRTRDMPKNYRKRRAPEKLPPRKPSPFPIIHDSFRLMRIGYQCKIRQFYGRGLGRLRGSWLSSRGKS
jgi:hypothetical protein